MIRLRTTLEVSVMWANEYLPRMQGIVSKPVHVYRDRDGRHCSLQTSASIMYSYSLREGVARCIVVLPIYKMNRRPSLMMMMTHVGVTR